MCRESGAPRRPYHVPQISGSARSRVSSTHFQSYTPYTSNNTLIMASVLKVQKKNQTVKDAKGKRKADAMDTDHEEGPSQKRTKNKQRVLMLSSRGVTHRMRHLMNDLEALLPHVKKGETLLSSFVLSPSAHLFRSRLKIGLQKSP